MRLPLPVSSGVAVSAAVAAPYATERNQSRRFMVDMRGDVITNPRLSVNGRKPPMSIAVEHGVVKNFHGVRVRTRNLVSTARCRCGVFALGRNSADRDDSQ